MGSILLDAFVEGDDVMIGAGSLVPQNKQLESGYPLFWQSWKTDPPLNRGGAPGYSIQQITMKWKNDTLDQENQTQP